MGAYLQALTLTLAIEVPIYAVVLRAAGEGWLRAARLGMAANLLSHPLAFLVVYPLLHRVLASPATLTVVEVAVMTGEAALVWARTRRPEALIAAALANLSSLAIGVAVH